MNKREFKKDIAYTVNSVCESLLAVSMNTHGADEAKVEDAVMKALACGEDVIRKSNIFFDKGLKAFQGDKKAYSKAKKAFFVQLFDRLNQDFDNGMEAVMKEFNEAIPAAEKEANKA